MAIRSFAIRLDTASVDALRVIARRKSFELNKNFNWCCLVRAAIDKLVKQEKVVTPISSER